MKARHCRSPARSPRCGHILVMFAITATVLIGMLGLVIDAGLLMTSQRHAQNAADAAARACAVRVRYEESKNGAAAINGSASLNSTLQTLAESYALGSSYNKVPNDSATADNVQVVVRHPPTTGPYATDLSGSTGHVANRYVEVLVTYPLDTAFIQVLGLARHRQMTSRAVAGYKSEPSGFGLVVLDPDGSPGLSISGTNASVTVNGDVFVYSLHQGVDGSGNPVGTIQSGQAAASINGSGATLNVPKPYTVHVSGGVDVASNFSPPAVENPLDAGHLTPVLDPFHIGNGNTSQLLIPAVTGNGTTTGSGVMDASYPNKKNDPVQRDGTANGVKVWSVAVGNGDIVTLFPGVYSSIKITGGDVTFNPGIYVLRPSGGGQGNILSITGGSSHGVVILGPGPPKYGPANIMFYNTGSTYNPVTGAPDTGDLSAATDYRPTAGDVSGQSFQGVQINGANVNFGRLNVTSSPFNTMLFYQRRFNTQNIAINDGLAPSAGGLAGVLYAKWALLKLAGQGTYNFALVVGTLSVSGNAVITVPDQLPSAPVIQRVYLVEGKLE